MSADGWLTATPQGRAEAARAKLGPWHLAHWRVREMCAKVVARHEIGAGDACARIVSVDANDRARIAALRALAVMRGRDALVRYRLCGISSTHTG